MIRGNYKPFIILFVFLGLVPIFGLFFTMERTGHFNDALNALRGEYFLLGIPVNPLGGFALYFIPSVLLAVGIGLIGAVLAKHPFQSAHFRLFKPFLLFLITLCAAIIFEFSMILALNVNIWFEDGIVLGMEAPITTGFLTVLSMILLIPLYYLLHKSQ